MTVNELMAKMFEEEKDPKKVAILMEYSRYVANQCEVDPSSKANAREAFDISKRFVKTWPDFVTAVLTISMLGLKAENSGVIDEDTDLGDVDISDLFGEE